MISRHWTGTTKPGKSEEYILHLSNHTFKNLKKIPGFISAQILQRDAEDGVEFLIVSNWENVESIKQFAGNDFDLAVVPKVVQDLMLKFDQKVKHFDVTYETTR